MVKKRSHPQPHLWNLLDPVVKQMRREPTLAEQVLWAELRGRKICGKKFRRQHAVDRFVVDFLCPEAALIIEIDGPIHQLQIEQDLERQHSLTQMGFHFLRFSNDQVLHHLDVVTAQIRQALETQS
jgi:very-short-patch-repair endonuclease